MSATILLDLVEMDWAQQDPVLSSGAQFYFLQF